MFGVGHNGMINPPEENRYFHLNMAEIVQFDQDVYDLIMDLTLIIDIAKVCEYFTQSLWFIFSPDCLLIEVGNVVVVSFCFAYIL